MGKWVTPILKDEVREGEFAAIGSTTTALLAGAIIFIVGFVSYNRVGEGMSKKSIDGGRRLILYLVT